MEICSYVPYGADGIVVRIEVDIRRGIPGVDVSGLADGAVREARERVRAAFRNSGLTFPQDRILVNLAPAGVRKEGAALDLPIALAVSTARVPAAETRDILAVGELELSGRVRPVRGVVAAVWGGLAAGVLGFIVPRANGPEAAMLAPGRVVAVESLSEAVHALNEYLASGHFPAIETDTVSAAASAALPACGDFAEAHGRVRYKRALEIAAAGGHHVLAFGPPGAGKTMLARMLPGILGDLTPEEAVEATRLHSLAGSLEGEAIIRRPPFRSPHHSASTEGMLGGGRSVRPGEISLAHHGVLFLDEAPEFRADVLRALREPLEDGCVTIARAEGSARMPADFQLVLTANPCPCGRLGKDSGDCFCSSEEVQRHWRRLGAALLDRVEIRVPLRNEASAEKTAESSAHVAARVTAAHAMQRERFKALPIRRNARIGPAYIERFCWLDIDASSAFDRAVELLGFSGRARHAVLRVARTIADLAGSERVCRDHVLEAVQHRRHGDDPFDVLGN